MGPTGNIPQLPIHPTRLQAGDLGLCFVCLSFWPKTKRPEQHKHPHNPRIGQSCPDAQSGERKTFCDPRRPIVRNITSQLRIYLRLRCNFIAHPESFPSLGDSLVRCAYVIRRNPASKASVLACSNFLISSKLAARSFGVRSLPLPPHRPQADPSGSVLLPSQRPHGTTRESRGTVCPACVSLFFTRSFLGQSAPHSNRWICV